MEELPEHKSYSVFEFQYRDGTVSSFIVLDAPVAAFADAWAFVFTTSHRDLFQEIYVPSMRLLQVQTVRERCENHAGIVVWKVVIIPRS